MLEKKECCMEKLFLVTLWAKLLIITVNLETKLQFLVKIVDGSYTLNPKAQTSCTRMYTALSNQKTKSKKVAFTASSRSKRLLIFVNGNVFRIYLFRKTLNSIIYIEWEWKLHLGRLNFFRFFLDEIVRKLQWRLGYYILIKTGNCGKNSTKLGTSHRPLKIDIYPTERDF